MSSATISGTAYYCTQTNSPSIKLSITYPTDIPNLSYNFTLTIIVNKQTLFPKITYTQVHTQTIYVPKREIVLNQLQAKTMYQLVVRFGFHNHRNNDCQEKVVFVFTEGVPEGVDQELEQQSQPTTYSQVVRQNIKGYFNEYHSQSSHHNRPSPAFNQSLRSTSTRKSQTSCTNSLCNSQTMMKVIGENDPLINKKKLQKYILQGRKSSSVNDYLKTNDYLCFDNMNKVYKNQKQRRQHMEKALLVTKTINMFGEIYQNDEGIDDIQSGGRGFFKNEWFMGPFYSYDQNEKQMKSNKRSVQHQQ